jgi:hypothetical protein
MQETMKKKDRLFLRYNYQSSTRYDIKVSECGSRETSATIQVDETVGTDRFLPPALSSCLFMLCRWSAWDTSLRGASVHTYVCVYVCVKVTPYHTYNVADWCLPDHYPMVTTSEVDKWTNEQRRVLLSYFSED